MQPHIEVRRPNAIFIEDLLIELQKQAWEMGRDGVMLGDKATASQEKVMRCVEMLVAQSRQ